MNKKLKYTFLIVISTIFITVAAAILFISPITKHVVEKYDEKYTGRKITMDWAYTNPFTGYVYISNLKIYEFKSDSIFISADGLGLNFSLLKILSKTYEISQITLDHPLGILSQNTQKLNIDDLIKKFSPKTKAKPKAAVHFNILNIKIIDGKFWYREKTIPINYCIQKVNIESSGKWWDIDSISTNFSFLSGTGTGNIQGNCAINSNTLDYRFDAIVNKFDLQIIDQYLKDLANYGNFSANVDADIQATGNFNNKENINARGILAINNFHFGKNKNEDYASFSKLVLAIEKYSPIEGKYFFDSVSIINPYLKYEQYDHLNNIETMFGKDGANIKAVTSSPASFNLIIEIARYVKVLTKRFFQGNYKINKLAIYNGDLVFNDYSFSEKFSASVNPLSFIADSIRKTQNRVEGILTSKIKPYGNIFVKLSINPNDSNDFDLNYHLQKLPVAMFNPYIISYTSFPLDRGTLELKGKWKVRNGHIQSNNHLIIIDPRTSKRIRNKDRKWIPMPLVMFFIRDRGNIIDYEIPITGNLNNPKFHLSDAILDLFGNIFLKPPTTPYRLNVKNTENEIEKSIEIKWERRKCLLQPNENIFVNELAVYLAENPHVSISIHSNPFEKKEKESILFYEAKKKYFLIEKNKDDSTFSIGDSIEVDKMSVKDLKFVKYLNKHSTDTLQFTIQQKCRSLINDTIVNATYKHLLNQRENNFLHFFKENGTENRIKIYAGKNKIPYNGFSIYKINYKGDIPNSLIKAYQHMNKLNNEAPRNKYIKQRKKISAVKK